MYIKVGQVVSNSGYNKVIEKQVFRNSQIIKTKSAFNKGKLYYREWKIEEHAGPKVQYSRSYYKGELIPNSTTKIDFMA